MSAAASPPNSIAWEGCLGLFTALGWLCRDVLLPEAWLWAWGVPGQCLLCQWQPVLHQDQ